MTKRTSMTVTTDSLKQAMASIQMPTSKATGPKPKVTTEKLTAKKTLQEKMKGRPVQRLK